MQTLRTRTKRGSASRTLLNFFFFHVLSSTLGRLSWAPTLSNINPFLGYPLSMGHWVPTSPNNPPALPLPLIILPHPPSFDIIIHTADGWEIRHSLSRLPAFLHSLFLGSRHTPRFRLYKVQRVDLLFCVPISFRRLCLRVTIYLTFLFLSLPIHSFKLNPTSPPVGFCFCWVFGSVCVWHRRSICGQHSADI